VIDRKTTSNCELCDQPLWKGLQMTKNRLYSCSCGLITKITFATFQEAKKIEFEFRDAPITLEEVRRMKKLRAFE